MWAVKLPRAVESNNNKKQGTEKQWRQSNHCVSKWTSRFSCSQRLACCPDFWQLIDWRMCLVAGRATKCTMRWQQSRDEKRDGNCVAAATVLHRKSSTIVNHNGAMRNTCARLAWCLLEIVTTIRFEERRKVWRYGSNLNELG